MQPEKQEVFVFGSNLRGAHGAGAAKTAVLLHGAIYGQGEGLQGNAYAIPTKGENLRSLPLDTIAGHVAAFLVFANKHPELTFNVTRIGCGLAGYTDQDIAPMFSCPPDNVILPQAWGGDGFDW